MSKHYANAHWEGNLVKGRGKYTLKTNGAEGNLSYSSRFEDDKSSSSPEELIGAALASCFSMALSNALDKEGFRPERIETSAEVTLGKSDAGFSISDILLKTRGKVGGVDKAKFLEIAEGAKKGCPVSRALAGTNISLQAELVTEFADKVNI
jgi:osmotically inducible protein OsmC